MQIVKSLLLLLVGLLSSFMTAAMDLDLHLLGDLTYSSVDSVSNSKSYLEYGYGKFRYPEGNTLGISQLDAVIKPQWGNFSGQVTMHAFADGTRDSLGVSEAYLQYRSLPSSQGYRTLIRAGFMYPMVSLTNIQTGWNSPYTLNYSAINSWVGEELRHQGLEVSITRLGKFHDSEQDIQLGLTLFQGNDPAGAVVSWHGWTHSNRVSLRHETLPLPNSQIGFVPEESDVFLELDDRVGHHVWTKWNWNQRVNLLAGYYDNQADPRVVENIQWAWRTRFRHLGAQLRLPGDIELIGQWMDGNTLMQSSSGTIDLVNNDYDSAFLMVSRKFGDYRLSIRGERFRVDDLDTMTFDNNSEEGEAITVNLNYRFSKNVFMHAEFDWLDSRRASRVVAGYPERLIEKQSQLLLRWYY